MTINTDRIVSLSAMAVGIGSLFAVVYQTHLTRQAQHASVLPYLMISLNSNDRGVQVNWGAWYAAWGAADTEKADIVITYASVYGGRWRIRSSSIVPERL